MDNFHLNRILTVDEKTNWLYSTARNAGISNLGVGILNMGYAVQSSKKSDFIKMNLKLKSVKALTAPKKLKITWSNPGNINCDGYKIYRSNKLNGTYERIKTLREADLGEYTYIDKGLTSNKSYYYKVRGFMSYNGKNIFSSYSNILSGKPN